MSEEPELVVGPVHAWRVFKVKVDWGNKWFEDEQMELALASISASHVYSKGVNVSKRHPGNYKDHSDVFGRLAFHGHDRGFWAMGSLGWLMQRFRDKVMRSKFDDRPSYVIGEVTLSGAIAGHEQGWYAEELAVERLICARNVGRYANPIARLLKRARHDEHVHALGEVYDVPVVCSTMDKADLDDRLRGVCHAPLWKKEGPWNSDSNDDASKSSGGAKTPSPMAIVGPRQYEELTKKLFQQGPKPSDTPLLQELPSKVRQQLGLPPDVG